MKMRKLVGEGKTDGMDEAASSSLVTSQALRPLLAPRSLATRRAVNPIPPQAHASSRLGGTRSSSLELPLMMDRVAALPINLN
jgi:hypothetical protein